MTACSSRFIRRHLERQAKRSSGSVSSVRATSRQPRRPTRTQQRPRRTEIPAPGAAAAPSAPCGPGVTGRPPSRGSAQRATAPSGVSQPAKRRHGAPRSDSAGRRLPGRRRGAARSGPESHTRRGQGGARPSAAAAERREEPGGTETKWFRERPAAARRAGQEPGPRGHPPLLETVGLVLTLTGEALATRALEIRRRGRAGPADGRTEPAASTRNTMAPALCRESVNPCPRPARARNLARAAETGKGVRCRSRQGALRSGRQSLGSIAASAFRCCRYAAGLY